jgi:hypothetical protein
MTKRNLVVREMINNPNRNGGKHSDKREKVLSTAAMKEFDMQADKPEIDLRAEVESTINQLVDAIHELAPDEGFEEFFVYGSALKRAKSLLKLLKANEDEAILIAARHVELAAELEDFSSFETK